MAPNLSFGSGSLITLSSQAHPTRVSTLSGPGTAPVSGQLCGTTSGELAIVSRFPVAFRLPAFASQVVRPPLGNWASLAGGLPATPPCPDPNRVPTFHTHEK